MWMSLKQCHQFKFRTNFEQQWFWANLGRWGPNRAKSYFRKTWAQPSTLSGIHTPELLVRLKLKQSQDLKKVIFQISKSCHFWNYKIPISDLDSSMRGMFHYAEAFNQPLNNWDVSNVTTMRRMFRHQWFRSCSDAGIILKLLDLHFWTLSLNHCPQCKVLQSTSQQLGRLFCHQHEFYVPSRQIQPGYQ